jgi:hypothetical protein
MELSSDTLALLFIIAFIILLLVGTMYAITSKNKSRGSSMNSVTFFGATSQFQTLDQKAATEHVLDVQAEKKMGEEESGEPDKK